MLSTWKAEVLPRLQLLNKLYSLLGSDAGIDLPSIVVVGSQSSGKSSVLERLSGVKLPRAANLCTRAPIVLSMTRGSEIDPTVEHRVANHDVTNSVKFGDVANAVQKIMDDRGESISDKEICVSVQSPDGKDLTVIDLPGIVYTENEQTVKNLIAKYVEKKSVLILCVLDATQDVDAAEAVKISKSADPEGDRTIGVLTKVDRLDNMQTLGSLFKERGAARFKLGLVAVRNPSTTAQGGEESEQEFFRKVEAKKVILPGHHGIDALAERLCKLQADNLKEHMPGVLEQVMRELARLESEVKDLKVPRNPGESARILRQANSALKRHLHNVRHANLGELPADEDALRVPAQIDSIIKQYKGALRDSRPRVFSLGNTLEVHEALKHVAGQALPNFLPVQVFERLVRTWTEHYAELTKNTWTAMAGKVETACRFCVKRAAHPKLQQLMLMGIIKGLYECVDKGFKDIVDMLDKEHEVVFTQNNYYTETLKKVEAAIATEDEETTPGNLNFLIVQDLKAKDIPGGIYTRMATSQSGYPTYGKGNDRLTSYDGGNTWNLARLDPESGTTGDFNNIGAVAGIEESDELHLAQWDEDSHQIEEAKDGCAAQLCLLLGASLKAASSLRTRSRSHDPADQLCVQLQVSIFAYDKVMRKRIVDEVEKAVRFHLYGFLADKREQLEDALVTDFEAAHEKLIAEAAAEKERREELEAKIQRFEAAADSLRQHGHFVRPKRCRVEQ